MLADECTSRSAVQQVIAELGFRRSKRATRLRLSAQRVLTSKLNQAHATEIGGSLQDASDCIPTSVSGCLPVSNVFPSDDSPTARVVWLEYQISKKQDQRADVLREHSRVTAAMESEVSVELDRLAPPPQQLSNEAWQFRRKNSADHLQFLEAHVKALTEHLNRRENIRRELYLRPTLRPLEARRAQLHAMVSRLDSELADLRTELRTLRVNAAGALLSESVEHENQMIVSVAKRLQACEQPEVIASELGRVGVSAPSFIILRAMRYLRNVLEKS